MSFRQRKVWQNEHIMLFDLILPCSLVSVCNTMPFYWPQTQHTKCTIQSFWALDKGEYLPIFSSPGRSPGRAIVLPPASALTASPTLAKCWSFTINFFMWWARRCQASYPVPVTGLVLLSHQNICYDPSSEPSQWDGSDEGSQHMTLCRINKYYP